MIVCPKIFCLAPKLYLICLGILENFGEVGVYSGVAEAILISLIIPVQMLLNCFDASVKCTEGQACIKMSEIIAPQYEYVVCLVRLKRLIETFKPLIYPLFGLAFTNLFSSEKIFAIYKARRRVVLPESMCKDLF